MCISPVNNGTRLTGVYIGRITKGTQIDQTERIRNKKKLGEVTLQEPESF